MSELPMLRAISAEHDDPRLFPEEVHRLHEQGEANQALALLRTHLKTERDERRKALQKELADNPYLWLKSAEGKTPTLYTVNGMGTALYGEYMPDDEGNYIATQWITLLFVPIFPLSAWVVRSAEDGGWYFLAKAPLPPFARGMRMFSSAAMALLVLWGLFGVYEGRTRTDLMVLNAHDVPVSAMVGGVTYELEPGGWLLVESVPATEPVDVVASAPDGVVIDKQTFDLTEAVGSSAVWNINGRGILMKEYVRYSDGGMEPPDSELLGAPTLLMAGDIDYLFDEPPDQIEMGKNTSFVDKSWLVEIGFGRPLSDQLGLLADAGRSEQATETVLAELEADPDDAEALRFAAALLETSVGQELAGRLRGRQPDSVDVHRFYQNVHGTDTEEIRAEYLKLKEEQPDKAIHWYLYGRTLPDLAEEAAVAYRRALELDPDLAYAHLGLGYRALAGGDAASAKASLGRFAAAGATEAGHVFDMRLLAQRQVDGSWWSDGFEQVLQSSRDHGMSPYRVMGREVMLRSASGTFEPEDVFELGVDLIYGTEGDIAQQARARQALARGDLAAARAALAAVGDPDARALFTGLLVELSGDGEGAGAWVSEHEQAMESVVAHTLDFYATATAVRAGLPVAEGRLAAVREEIGSHGPNRVFAATADLGSASSIDAVIGDVGLQYRGIAYALAGILSDSPEAAEHARTQATRWGMPGEVPFW